MIKATYIDHMGSDLSVVNAARVSFGKKSGWDWEEYDDGRVGYILSDKDTKLIHYLASHKHMSPFGHAFASFHVKAPIFVARQLVKHKFLRWNEISRRYVDDEPEFYVPEVWRGRAEDKKQGSSGEVKIPYMVPHEFNKSALYEYETLLESALAKPQNQFAYGQPALVDLAASYAMGVVKNHPFLDGNKRTGFMLGVGFLELNGYRFAAEEADAVIRTLALAGNAVITGAMSKPHHRYQARIAWLLPLLVGVALAAPRRAPDKPIA
jgi:thymidylate synthase (FAD)